MIFYKSELHEEETNTLLEKFGLKDVSNDIEYGSFAYLVGATGKAFHIMKFIDDENHVDVDGLLEMIGVFSSSEKSMIKFALQCFNKSFSDIILADVMWSLDETNTKVVKQAIDIRY